MGNSIAYPYLRTYYDILIHNSKNMSIKFTLSEIKNNNKRLEESNPLNMQRATAQIFIK